MINRLMIAGFGGQGVMMIGKLIGQCAMEQDLNATFFPSYGAEQRGGTANCTVIQSDRMIGSPTSSRPVSYTHLDVYKRQPFIWIHLIVRPYR